jgi:hypothetical protein
MRKKEKSSQEGCALSSVSRKVARFSLLSTKAIPNMVTAIFSRVERCLRSIDLRS